MEDEVQRFIMFEKSALKDALGIYGRLKGLAEELDDYLYEMFTISTIRFNPEDASTLDLHFEGSMPILEADSRMPKGFVSLGIDGRESDWEPVYIRRLLTPPNGLLEGLNCILFTE